jgi:hypothetical protein
MTFKRGLNAIVALNPAFLKHIQDFRKGIAGKRPDLAKNLDSYEVYATGVFDLDDSFALPNFNSLGNHDSVVALIQEEEKAELEGVVSQKVMWKPRNGLQPFKPTPRTEVPLSSKAFHWRFAEYSVSGNQ